jgi:hypothetical protein
MTAHGYDKKIFPLSAAQGRVLYHVERLFRSTGHGMREHAHFLQACADMGLNVRRVQDWNLKACVHALRAMERCAAPMALFRATATGWQDFT